MAKSCVIDWEHQWTPEEKWRKRGGRPGEYVQLMVDGSLVRTLSDQSYRLDMHLRDMDRGGIDIAVLTSGGDDLEDCKSVNDKLSQVMQQYPKRFVGMASVNPLGGKKALAELERAIKVLGLKGVIISSQEDGLSLDAPQLRPFYEKVVELDIPVFVHVGGRLGYDALKGPYDLHRNIGREFDMVNAITRLACSGVLDDFPSLKLVMAHLGGGIAAIAERTEWWQQGREPIPEIKLPKKPFREYLDMLYYDTAGNAVGERALRCALTTLDPNHLVFATDYPHIDRRLETMKPYIDAIRALDLDEETKEGILGRTAAKLLKIPID